VAIYISKWGKARRKMGDGDWELVIGPDKNVSLRSTNRDEILQDFIIRNWLNHG